MPVVRLEFRADVSMEEAWAIAERLEQAAIKRDYRAISAWVEPEGGREGLLGTEAEPIASSAMREEPGGSGAPTAVGDPEGGAVSVRRYGELD